MPPAHSCPSTNMIPLELEIRVLHQSEPILTGPVEDGGKRLIVNVTSYPLLTVVVIAAPLAVDWPPNSRRL